MGSLKLPATGAVYIDAVCVIYAVEKVKPYDALLDPLWRAAATRRLSLVSSELSVMEVLVKPIAAANAKLEASFRAFLFDSTELQLKPVDRTIIERAAQIRAATRLKPPDAIHAATALAASTSLFVTNDADFRRVPELSVAVLSDVLKSP